MDYYKKLLYTVSSVVLILAVIPMIAGALYLYEQTSNSVRETTATFSAEGETSVQPDTAEITFSVVTQNESASQAQEENNNKVSAVIDFLKQQGIVEEDIQTSSYNLYPQYDYEYCLEESPEARSCPPRIASYEVNQSVTFSSKNLQLMGSVVGQLSEQGANQIHGFRLFVEDPEAFRQEARADALKKVREKAMNFSKEAGIQLGDVVSINESSGYSPIVSRGIAEGLGGGDFAAAPIQPGQQDITVSITVTYEIK